MSMKTPPQAAQLQESKFYKNQVKKS